MAKGGRSGGHGGHGGSHGKSHGFGSHSHGIGHGHGIGHNHGIGHSHGIGHNHFGSHGFGHRHSSFGRSRSVGPSAPSFESVMDIMHNSQAPPTLVNGIYTFQGSEMAFRIHSENTAQPTQINMVPMMPMMPMMQMMPGPVAMSQMQMQSAEMSTMPAVPPMATQSMNLPVQQANITLVGNKTKSSNVGCLIMTIMCACFIFPLCFMCCGWWKKMVNPMYELSAQAYQSIGSFIRANPTVNNLNLTVVDNAFSAEKGRILADAMSGSRITGLTFVNGAIALNGDQNELDNFAANVQPIKSLGVTSSIIWGELIV